MIPYATDPYSFFPSSPIWKKYLHSKRLTAIPKKTPTKNQKNFNVMKYSYLSIICGKYMVVSQNIMVNIIAIAFLLLLKNIESMLPTIAPKNDITMILIEFFGVL